MFENTKLFYLFLLLPFLIGLFVFFNLHFKKSAKKLPGKILMQFCPITLKVKNGYPCYFI